MAKGIFGRMPWEGGMQEGKAGELDTFGAVKKTREYRRDLEAASSDGRYVPYEASVELAKKHQPWEDPTDPGKDIMKELRLAVLESLELDDDKSVRIYTAAGTPLDVYHGVDGFVEITDPANNESFRVTLDVTMRQEKLEEGHKADVVFDVIDVPKPEADKKEVFGYLAKVEKVADEIVKTYKSKQSRGDNVRRAA